MTAPPQVEVVPMTDDPHAVLTVDEVAKRLRVSRSFAFELAARREIPVLRVGRRLLVPAEAFEAWMRANTELRAPVSA